jgi:sulfur carrier protein ThiS adenylyltransferase
MLTVNEHPYPFEEGLRLGELADRLKPGADILVLNGRPAPRDSLLQDRDICSLIKIREIPSALDMRQALAARHGTATQQKLDAATIGIMGLGGLGSAVALALAKVGVGRLLLADHDVVVLANIHRQHYFIDQIGMKKTTAMKKNMVRVNPFVSITPLHLTLTEANIPHLFGKVDVLVECLDDPAMKAAAMRCALRKLPHTGYVGASGVAGYGPGDEIRCRKIRERVYIVGDGVTVQDDDTPLFATRVGLAAHQQANQVVRILLGADNNG